MTLQSLQQRIGQWALGVLLAGLGTAATAVDPGRGVGVVDPGLNQPGVAGNVGGVARRSVRR